MSERTNSHRRDFLTGRAAGQVAAEAIQQAADHVAGFADALAPPQLDTQSTAPASYVVSIKRRAMACDFEVLLNANRTSNSRPTSAALSALDLVDELESQMTVYRDQSEIVDINRDAVDHPVDVESRLFALLQLAEVLYLETAGAFDITAGPLSRAWGFDLRQGRRPTDDEIDAALAHVGWDKVQLDTSTNQIQFRQLGVELNLNSIGKGYALDRAGEQLRDEGIDDFLLHGGRSTLLANGHRSGQLGWTARLRHPLRPQQLIAEFVLENEALSTSGSATQSYVIGGRRFGHLIDPRTGWPADEMHSATVIASSGAIADALSTAFYIMGVDNVQAYCAEHQDVQALLVLPSNRAGEVEVATFNIRN